MDSVDALVQVQRVDDVLLLRIASASIDPQTVAALNAYDELLQPISVIDFANVVFINSTGVTALLAFAAATRERGIHLFALNLSPHHQNVFRKGEMARFMPIIAEHDMAANRRQALRFR